ncbi:MAG: hypothetical protein KatS3mg105_1899 [Gemmatales bacterium]|nr:MAG: hypothetical protein KatS3mg105_1899 [Gemmatales bacterium]
MNRRDFLRTSFAGGSMVSLGLTVPTFLTRTAWAAPTADRAGSKDTILVVVQLTGGNDGLNTVVPFRDENYAKLRPTLRIPTNRLHKVNDELGLHPSMQGLADLLQDQALCIVQGVGYPNPNQSHFRSMDIWHAASLDRELTEGWIGKALRQTPQTLAFHLADNNESSPLALAGAPRSVPSVTSLQDFQLRTNALSSAERAERTKIIEKAAQTSAGSKPSLLDFVKRTAVNTYESSKRLQEVAGNYQPKVPYPNTPLANRLRVAAQLIEAGMGARIFYVSIGGFDTHANQLNTHANLLAQLSGAMTAFYKDLAARGHKDRILMMTFSEFGRRPYENGSKGTDHGAAAPMLLVGGKVKAGVVGEHPSLVKNVIRGNMRHNIDFRQVYATILDNWLGIPSKDVLGQPFNHVDIF